MDRNCCTLKPRYRHTISNTERCYDCYHSLPRQCYDWVALEERHYPHPLRVTEMLASDSELPTSVTTFREITRMEPIRDTMAHHVSLSGQRPRRRPGVRFVNPFANADWAFEPMSELPRGEFLPHPLVTERSRV